MVLINSPYFLSLLSALLLWLSFPAGGGLWPLLAVALVPLLVAASHKGRGASLLCGFITGFLHFLSLIYWIVLVVGKYGGLPWYLAVLALIFLALYMSLYVAVFAYLARIFYLVLPGVLALLFIPALWVGLDWLRGVLFTGFPWMDLGYSLYQTPVLIQLADLVGHHGLSFLIVLANVLVFLILKSPKSVQHILLLLLPTSLLFGAIAFYSVSRLHHIDNIVSAKNVQQARIGIVQGNIDQGVKWSPDNQQVAIDKYSSATEKLAKNNSPLLVVWPETALPFYPPANDQMEPLKALVKRNGISLLSGAPWYEIIDRAARKVKFYNSAMFLTQTGEIEDTYFKNHLVPFGEYVPLKKYLPFLAPMVEAVGDFSPGQIDKPISWEKAELGILICFESVFPELSRQWVLAGANVLINLTNDAWYGKSSAPYQSLAMAVFRAVETRRSLVRSANTGISAFVSPTGEILNDSPLFQSWAEVENVVLLDEKTFWVEYGYLFGPLCLLLAAVGSALTMLRKNWT